jgi:hypothetical protein
VTALAELDELLDSVEHQLDAIERASQTGSAWALGMLRASGIDLLDAMNRVQGLLEEVPTAVAQAEQAEALNVRIDRLREAPVPTREPGLAALADEIVELIRVRGPMDFEDVADEVGREFEEVEEAIEQSGHVELDGVMVRLRDNDGGTPLQSNPVVTAFAFTVSLAGLVGGGGSPGIDWGALSSPLVLVGMAAVVAVGLAVHGVLMLLRIRGPPWPVSGSRNSAGSGPGRRTRCWSR